MSRVASIISRLVSSERPCSTVVRIQPPPLQPRLEALPISANHPALLQPSLSGAVPLWSCPATSQGKSSPARSAAGVPCPGHLEMVTSGVAGSSSVCPDVSADGNVSVLCISLQISPFQATAGYQTPAAAGSSQDPTQKAQSTTV